MLTSCYVTVKLGTEPSSACNINIDLFRYLRDFLAPNRQDKSNKIGFCLLDRVWVSDALKYILKTAKTDD